MTGHEPRSAGRNLLVAVASYVAAALLFAMMAVVVADVSARYLFDRPIRGAFEIVGFLLGLLVFSGLVMASDRNDHITVSVLDALYRGRVRWFQQAFVLLFSIAAVGFIAFRLFVAAERMRARGLLALSFDFQVAPIVYLMALLAALACLLLVGLLVRHLRSWPARSPEATSAPRD
jgi:TRAP-type transport system small permease protein